MLKEERTEGFDLGSYIRPTMGKLCLRDTLQKLDTYCSLNAVVRIPKCPYLTHLSLSRFNLDQSILEALRKATQQGLLPCLTHLSLASCRPINAITGKLPVLFRCTWPTLIHMNLNECQLNFVDLPTISSFLKNGDKGMLPKLTSLVLYFGDFFDKICAEKIIYDEEKRLRIKWCRKIDLVPLSSAFHVPLPGVTKLWLHELNKEEYQDLVELLNSGLFPNLTELSISMWKYVDLHKNVQVPVDKLVHQGVHWISFQAYGFTERLPSVNVLTLNRLTLHRVIRAEEHLIVLSRSTALVNLHKLDLSHSSCITGNLTTLLCHSFPLLSSLILSDCGLNAQDLCSLALTSVEGRLSELRHLDISDNSHLHGQLNQLFVEGCKWQQLLSLNVESSSTRCFQYLKLKVKSDCLSSLQELRFTAEEDISDTMMYNGHV